MLEKVASYQITEKTVLFIRKGSLLDFSCNKDSAIVNVTNMGCLGGGGIDAIVSRAGGERLLSARLSLPVVDGEATRCVVGDAKLTGPGNFGRIGTNYVIHTVGPNYHEYDDYNDADELLMSAYGASLETAGDANLEEVAFALISVDGLHRGERSVKQVLALAVHACGSWAQERIDTTVHSIHLVASNDKEADKLVDCAQKLGLITLAEEKKSGLNDSQNSDNPAEEKVAPRAEAE